LTPVFTSVSLGEEKENMTVGPGFTPDRPMTPEELAALRQRLSQMSPTALLDALLRSLDALQNGARWQAATGAIHPGTCTGLEGTKEGRLAASRTASSHDRASTLRSK
jgi:hypothetical protein